MLNIFFLVFNYYTSLKRKKRVREKLDDYTRIIEQIANQRKPGKIIKFIKKTVTHKNLIQLKRNTLRRQSSKTQLIIKVLGLKN